MGSDIPIKINMKRTLTVLALAALCGCGTTPGHIQPGAMTKVSLGMTKAQLIKALGKPESVAANKEGEETLTYVLERPWWQWAPVKVKLVNGAVTEYGEVPHEEKH